MVARNPPSKRRLKTAVILAAVLMMGALVIFLGARNREYIEQNLPDTLSLGKILPPASTSSKSSSLGLSPRTVAQIQNASLGFESVFLINLPIRTDKLDAQILAASLTGFNFTVIPGVQNDEVAPATLPWAFAKDTPNVHGCWRAHLNALRKMVYEGVQTALIIEDDSDWDVNLMTRILPSIAAGTQKLLHTDEKHQTPHSPYGDGWDLLWLGHCASELRIDAERFLIHNDPTVRPPSKAWEMWDSGYNAKAVTNSTRVVSKANNAICTNGYAVSLAGARKILYHASIEPNPDPIDTRFNSLCDSKYSKKYPHFECLHVYPAIFNSYRKAGREDGDSDQAAGKKDKEKNDKTEQKVKMRDHATAFNNVWSVMLNLGNLVKGKEPEMQWKLDGWEKERELDEREGVRLEWQEAGWWKGKEEEREVEEKGTAESGEGEEVKEPDA